jgi:hypothetical protein
MRQEMLRFCPWLGIVMIQHYYCARYFCVGRTVTFRIYRARVRSSESSDYLIHRLDSVGKSATSSSLR